MIALWRYHYRLHLLIQAQFEVGRRLSQLKWNVKQNAKEGDDTATPLVLILISTLSTPINNHQCQLQVTSQFQAHPG